MKKIRISKVLGLLSGIVMLAGLAVAMTTAKHADSDLAFTQIDGYISDHADCAHIVIGTAVVWVILIIIGLILYSKGSNQIVKANAKR